jgi:hypothetical protein
MGQFTEKIEHQEKVGKNRLYDSKQTDRQKNFKKIKKLLMISIKFLKC